MNVSEALMVAEIGCVSGILKQQAVEKLAHEVVRLRRIVEAAGEDSTPPGERDEMEEAAA